MSKTAVKVMETASDERKTMFLNFNAGSKVYGIEIRHVFQIIAARSVTEMPNLHPA